MWDALRIAFGTYLAVNAIALGWVTVRLVTTGSTRLQEDGE